MNYQNVSKKPKSRISGPQPRYHYDHINAQNRNRLTKFNLIASIICHRSSIFVKSNIGQRFSFATLSCLREQLSFTNL